MQNNFNYEEITSKVTLKEEFSYKYVTLRHYRSRWLIVKEYMGKRRLKFLSLSVCKDFMLDFYKGRTHGELTDEEKLIEKAVSVLTEYMENGSIIRKCKVRYLDGSIGLMILQQVP